VNNPGQNIPTAPPVTPTKKQRHGCLTALLIVIIVLNAIGILGSAILAVVGTGFLGVDITVPLWENIVSIVLGIMTIVCAVAIFMWKKWGFWGLVAVEVINVASGVATGDGFSIVSSILGAVIAVGLLYGTLQIGKEDKGWTKLE
jgi:hypothetical protein